MCKVISKIYGEKFRLEIVRLWMFFSGGYSEISRCFVCYLYRG